MSLLRPAVNADFKLRLRIIMIMKRALLLIHFSPRRRDKTKNIGWSWRLKRGEYKNSWMLNFTLNKSYSVSSMYSSLFPLLPVLPYINNTEHAPREKKMKMAIIILLYNVEFIKYGEDNATSCKIYFCVSLF